MNRYYSLLRQEHVLRQLSIIQLISYFGAWFSNVAIYTLLIEMEVSASIIALTAAMHFLPGVIQAPFSGVVIDRFEPKKVMLFLIVIEIISTLMLLSISNESHLPLLFVLIFFRMGASSFYFTLEMALLPRILKVKQLQLANEIHSIIWSLSYTVGMAISGFVVYKVGVSIAFVLDAILFLIALILLIRLSLHVKPNETTDNFIIMMRETFVYIVKNPLVLCLLILHAFIGMTAYDALVALMVEQYYASIIATSLALGLMHASRAVGLVLGPLLLGKYMTNKRLFYLLLFQAFSLFLWAMVFENFYFSLMASVVVGLGTTTLWSYTYTLLQHNIDERFYGRVVAYNDMLFLLMAALTSLFIGFLSDHGVALGAITLILGFGFIIAALFYLFVLKTFSLKDI
ncbi:MAG: MFS transporter [Campylobacterota bacterium]|nr:MFS transporter [Campylobacterota bacterium]